MERILITGASGRIGTFLRHTMQGKYAMRLSDITPIQPLADNEESFNADITDLEATKRAVDGVDGIVHLGGISKEDSWDRILQTNFVGTYNIYEAARQCGVKRVVFASSNHVVGFYRRSEFIGTKAIVRPDTRYGVSKAFGEALGSLYADKYGLEVTCIRIGNVADRPVDVRRLAIWISPRDLTQLIEIGLKHPNIHFEIVYGASDNSCSWWDNGAATRLGYRPQDRSEDYAKEILANAPHANPDCLAEIMQGGDFVSVDADSVAVQKGNASRRT